MKFSYSYLKQLVPSVRNKEHLRELLLGKVFEVEGFSGDTVDVAVPPNRFSDASGHWGLAREIAAAMGKIFKEPALPKLPAPSKKTVAIQVQNTGLCPRYIGARFRGVTVGSAPAFIRRTLAACGVQSINNVVDILNYVMLEVGQPMHAFDAAKLSGARIVVRKAKKGETITTLDNKKVRLTPDILVIADAHEPLAIAGIKGGTKAGIGRKTTDIIVESANFDALSIYKTSRLIGIITDASARFSRKLSPLLAGVGMARSRQLLERHTGACFEGWVDISSAKLSKTVLKFDMERFRDFSGVEMKQTEVMTHLQHVGCKIIVGGQSLQEETFLVEAPPLRQDIEHFEDLAEEVLRLHGFDNIPPQSPHMVLKASEYEGVITFKDKVRQVVAAAGYSEVILPSFALPKSKGAIEVLNPPSSNTQFLRTALWHGLEDACAHNLKHAQTVRIFEIGRVFEKNKNAVMEREHCALACAISGKIPHSFFELKGIVVSLLAALGLTDWEFVASDDGLEAAIKVSDRNIGSMGFLSFKKGSGAYAELDAQTLFEIEEGEYEYTPIPRFPAVERDISAVVTESHRVGEMVRAMQLVDMHLIRDVDLVDEFGDPRDNTRTTLTFRIVFQSDKRTLTDKEVNALMKKVERELKYKFNVAVK